MSLQIAKLVLYSRKGQVREVAFKLGGFNVITGGSKTGKSAIIDIIDYCTGRSECNIADGVIRKYVSWYGVLFQLGDGQIFVARKNPEPGEKTNPDVYLERGTRIAIPQPTGLYKNTTVNTLERILGNAIGISENEHRPPLPTREPLEATFRHALLFSFQDQNDIDSKQRLFHRQGEEFISQAIRDTVPYFLGAVDEDRLLKQSQLDQMRKHLRQLERQFRDLEAVDNSSYPRAQTLIDEAKQVGLLDERLHPSNFAMAVSALRRVADEDDVLQDRIVGDGEDILANMRSERQSLRSELETVHDEIRQTRTFTSDTSGYEREAKEQRARLSAVGLVKGSKTAEHRQCPVCESFLAVQIPAVEQITHALNDLSVQLAAVEAENPRLLGRLAGLQDQERRLEQKLRDNQQRISAQIQQNAISSVQQDSFILRARTIGKVIQYVESLENAQGNSSIQKQIEATAAQVSELERVLDIEAVRERLNGFLNIIGGYMTEYSSELALEHSGSRLRLDVRNLTVVADTIDGPVPLYRMGSGENWIGYHVIAHLALHRWFRVKGRPVPAFIIFDQPSQGHYPPDRDAEGSISDLDNEDQVAIKCLFHLIATAAKDLAPQLQIIVTDHADLNEEWFRDAVVERWRRGEKLIPEAWRG